MKHLAKFCFVTATGACLSACGTAANAVTQEQWPGEDWPISTPLDQGLDPSAIDSLVSDLASGVYGFVDQFLLIRNGYVVADHRWTHNYDSVALQFDTTNYQYNYDDPAWHPYYGDTDLHTLQSVTKSVTAAALGIAIDEGLIPGVSTPVMPYFPEYSPDVTDTLKTSITLEDFLTMRSGIAWAVPGQTYDDNQHPTVVLENSDAWIQYVIDQPMAVTPGTLFDYNDGVSVLLGKIVREATGQRIDDWARDRLFEPIGIRDFYWKITPDGEADTEGGLYLSTHDLARIGYLHLRGGVWNGEQIISEEWINISTHPTVTDVAPNNGRADAGYGYQWWVPDHADGRTEVFAGNGYGGQFLVVSREHDMVAVFNGWNIHGGDYRSTYRTFQNRIIPAVTAPTGG